MNVVDKLPQAEQAEAVKRLRAIWQADSESAARKLATKLIADYRRAGYDRAANCLEDDLDRCLASYQFPEQHWSHLRTTNVVESPFASVRLRTSAAKRFKKTKSGVCLAHPVLLRLSQAALFRVVERWHRKDLKGRSTSATGVGATCYVGRGGRG